MPSPLVLGSGSTSRAALLKAAGLDFEIDPAGIDESAIRKLVTRDRGAAAEDVADVLARAKAETVSERQPGALVIGSDQVLALGDQLFEKPQTNEDARRTLLSLQGKTHQLHSAVALAREGNVHWAHIETAHLTMRELSPEFIGRYLADAGDAVRQSVGAYQLEGLGVHLFEKINGDYFTILGLPLLALLARLRLEARGAP
ncbi:MAG: Maf family nucleotide pyrophosphatase [Alphaproteobacteria bacterium]